MIKKIRKIESNKNSITGPLCGVDEIQNPLRELLYLNVYSKS